jgi:hypothetical protein
VQASESTGSTTLVSPMNTAVMGAVSSTSLPEGPPATNIGDFEIGRGEFRDSISHVAFRPGAGEGALQSQIISVTLWDGEVPVMF